MPTRRRAFLALAVIAIAAAIGAWAWLSGGRHGGPVSIGIASVGGPFSLVNQDGKRVTDQDFRGRYLLVFFGYTYCPDVCPTTLQVMSQALDQLGPAAGRVQPVFITIDPERDTPEILKSYVGNFSPRLVGLTGSAAEIAAVAKAYRVFYQKAGPAGAKDYLMDHTSIIYLMGPDGAFLKPMTYTTDAKGLAADLAAALSGSS